MLLALLLALHLTGCDEPASFQADNRLERLVNPPRLVLSGNVVIAQCDRRIEADRVIAHLDGQTLIRADIPDRPVLRVAEQTLRAAWAVVDFQRGLATLGGGVSVLADGSELTCDLVELVFQERAARCLALTDPKVRGRIAP